MGPLIAVALSILCSAAAAQPEPDVRISLPDAGIGGADAPRWIEPLIPEPGSPEWEAARERGGRERVFRKDIRTLRHEHFRRGDVERRQVGLWKLRAFDEPWMTPIIMEELEREAPDVRMGVLDLLVERADDESDAAIVWAAVFDRDPDHRAAASQRLTRRVDQVGEVSERVRLVLAGALADERSGPPIAAAGLVNTFNIVELVPLLIHAQVAGGGGSRPRTGDLAWIMVATQTAFVSDLQPVVSDSAVGFDPQLSVISEGVLLRVGDAVVTTYRAPVHLALVDLTSRHYGSSTAAMGYERETWKAWYETEFRPMLAAKAEP